MKDVIKYEKYITAWRARKEKEVLETKKLARRAIWLAEKCADTLHQDFGAERIFLFGSLAEGYFRKNSDIDLIVEGLDDRYYFKALCKVHEVSEGFEVDLIPFEDYEYKEDVFKQGVLFDVEKKKWENSPADLYN